MLSAFRRTATRVPDRTATLYFDTPISYRELDRLTDALAAGLRGRASDPGERLAVYLQNVPQFLIAMVATWKAGGIMVSVNPMLKRSRARGRS